MLLHVLIWATALMLLVQPNIFSVAYSVDNNNKKVSLNKREVKSAFMLDEAADFDEIQEPDEENNGQRNVILSDISNLLNESPAEPIQEVPEQTVKYENQQENPRNVIFYKNKISSRKYVKSLITPKINVPNDILNNFHLNQGTTTNKNNKNCEITIPPFHKIVITPVVVVDVIPDTTTPIPTTSSCNDSLKNPCDKPVQVIQNLNINQQHIEILIQHCKENATTKAPYNSFCNKHKKFNENQKSSKSEYYSVTSSRSSTILFPKSTREFTVESPSNNILHPKYLDNQLQLLFDVTSNKPEKKYFDNPDKRFINFYPTAQERLSSSTKNTILKLKELEDEDYVEEPRRTTAGRPGSHLRHMVKNIIENTEDTAEKSIHPDSYSENSLNVLQKKFKSKNFLRQLSTNIDTEISNNKIQNNKLKSSEVSDKNDFKPYQDDKIYNRYPTNRQASMLTSTTNRDDISTIQDYTFAPNYLNYQRSSPTSNKENVNNIEYQKAKSRYYFKALQDYELRQKPKEVQPNYIENADRLSYTDFQSNFKPYYYPTELPSTNNYELLIKHQNPINFKFESNDVPYPVNSAMPHNSVPEMDNQQMKFMPQNFKNSQPSNNPTDFRKLYMQQSDENFDIQPNFNLDQSITAQEPILNPRKAQLQVESPPLEGYYFIPNYPIYNTGFGYPTKNNMKSNNLFNRRRRKNYINSIINKRETKKNILKTKFRPVRKIRQVHNLIPKPRTCGGYKNDSNCKNYLHNADVVLQLVQKLEYALSQQSNGSKCTTTEANSCHSCQDSQKNKIKQKRNLPLILPIIFANSRATEPTPVNNPISNIQLQVNPELVEKIEAMKLGIENAMSPVSIVKLNDREPKQTQASKLNPVLLQKLDELKLLIEMVGNVKRKTLRSEREENIKTKEEHKFDFDYDVITKRDLELQEKLDVAKLNLVSALKPNADNRNIFVPNWFSSTVKALIANRLKDVKSIFEEKAENDYLYDNYYNDDEYSNVIDHPVKKRNLDISTSTPVPTGIQLRKRTIHLLAMKKLLESIVELPFFLHQGADNNSLTNSVNETTTNSCLNTTNVPTSDENCTSSTPFTIKIEGLVNLSVSSMVSLYTPTLSTENVTNMTTVSCTETTTCENSANINNDSTHHNNKNNSTSINSDKIFQSLLLKVLNVLSENAISQFPNLTNYSGNPGKSLNHSVEQNITFSTNHVVGANCTTTATSNLANITSVTSKQCDKNITSKMTTHACDKHTTAHKTTCTTEETETTKCTHTKSTITTKKPVHVFVLSTHSSLPDLPLFGDVINFTPSYNQPVIVRKRSKDVKSKKCCTAKEYHKTHHCNNQSSTTPQSIEGNAIDITKERLSLLLNIIRKSSTISPTTNCTKRTTSCHTTCSDRKCVEKREVTKNFLGQPKIRSLKNPNLPIDTSAMKLISLAEHSLQLAEKYMQNQKTLDSHNIERSDTTTTSTQSSFLFDQHYAPNSQHKFKYNLFTPAANFFPMYVVKPPQSNFVSQAAVASFADVPASTPSMIITSNAVLNYNHTTVVSWPQVSDAKNITCLNSFQGITKKAEDKSEIPEYIVPMYSDLEESEDNLNSDYLDDDANEKVATSKSDRLKRDIKVVDEIQDILDKMKLETRINSLKKGRSVNIKKRSIENVKFLVPDDENIDSIETAKYNNPNNKFVKPLDMYVIRNSDLTKDYKKRFLMFKKNHKKRKHRKKKERTWKRLFCRSATKNPEHFLNQQTQNL